MDWSIRDTGQCVSGSLPDFGGGVNFPLPTRSSTSPKNEAFQVSFAARFSGVGQWNFPAGHRVERFEHSGKGPVQKRLRPCLKSKIPSGPP